MIRKAGIITALVCALAAGIPSCVYLAEGFEAPRFIHYYFMRPGIALGWLLLWGDNSARQPVAEVAITIAVYAVAGFALGALAAGIWGCVKGNPQTDKR